ncbi:hypothetical protein D3C74_170740 [compost metagenome]
MKVYELICHDKSMVLSGILDISEDHPFKCDLNGSSKKSIWKPMKVETLYKKTYKDFPNFGKDPVVSAKVRQIIEPYVKDQVEFLPISHAELDLYLINVLNIIDCVDWKRSDVHQMSDGSFGGFIKLALNFAKIPKDIYMFKIPEMATSWVFVTEAFKDIIEQHKLKGLDFSVEFDSEFTEEKELEQKRNYEAALKELEDYQGPEVSYEEARNLVDQGKTMASGKWRMVLDEKGTFWLGQLTLDLTYQWMSPIYIPPILLGQLWHEVEKSEN